MFITMNTNEIISDIRFITGYPEIVISDGKVEDAIEFTKNEMRSMLHDPEFEFEGYYVERSVMWGSCYHLKVQTGEISGIPISVGDINLDQMRQRGETDPDLFSWAEKFYENLHRIDNAPLGFGHVRPEREDRSYEKPETANYGE